MTFDEPTRTHDPARSLWARLRGGRKNPHRQGTRFSSADPAGLERRLADSDCFCRDTAVGKLYHRKQTSFREISPTDSLHVTVGEDGLVTSHVDRHSPLARRQPGGACRYSPLRIAAHNISGMAADLVRLALGPRPSRRHEHGAGAGLNDDEAVAHTVASREPVGTMRPPAPGHGSVTAERSWSVPGIAQGHRRRAIEAELGAIAGVERIEVDVAARTVLVVGPIDDESVRGGLARAGFEVEAAG